ncbi:MAG: endonuclease/exonuclease/phosphatase family protein [Bacteroidales bacterium]|jgi:endonuclease/exonuclease/phosphatase family metal-dependent hydrolase|nr:endonuclease/exonuclease/phosphatase family protein [Bacteroidales bacterium]
MDYKLYKKLRVLCDLNAYLFDTTSISEYRKNDIHIMKKLAFFALIIVFSCFSISAQGDEKQYEVVCVGFYNLENIFDTIHQEKVNDYEFLPNGKNKWNSEKYWSKVSNMAKVISMIAADVVPDGPAVLGVSEVENATPLKDIANDPQLKDRNYQFVHVDGPDRRGVDVALMYNPSYFKVDTFITYTLNMPDRPDFRTRHQLLVSGRLLGEEFHFIVVHWPSRSGGEEKSRPLRIASAELSKHIFDSIMAVKSNAKIVLMGDMNDDPVNKSIVNVLKATSDKKKLNKGGYLFNPSEALYKNGIGSLAYRDSWNFFDQIIVTPNVLSEDRSTWTYYQFKVFKEKFMIQQSGKYAGYPLRTFSGGAWTNGYSDHFPTYMLFIRKI